MKEYEKKIIACLLELAGERFSNNCCNDTPKEILDLMTEEEKDELDEKMCIWNNEPEEHVKGQPEYINYDYSLMNYFSDRVLEKD